MSDKEKLKKSLRKGKDDFGQLVTKCYQFKIGSNWSVGDELSPAGYEM